MQNLSFDNNLELDFTGTLQELFPMANFLFQYFNLSFIFIWLEWFSKNRMKNKQVYYFFIYSALEYFTPLKTSNMSKLCRSLREQRNFNVWKIALIKVNSTSLVHCPQLHAVSRSISISKSNTCTVYLCQKALNIPDLSNQLACLKEMLDCNVSNLWLLSFLGQKKKGLTLFSA